MNRHPSHSFAFAGLAAAAALASSACPALLQPGPKGHFTPTPGEAAAPAPDAAPAPAPEPEPVGWIIKVHNVRVATLRSGSSDHWDGAVADVATSNAGLCGVVGALVGGVAGAVVGGPAVAVGAASIGKGVSEALCPESRPLARERDPQAPDLVVALTVGDQTPEQMLRTPSARDSYEDAFDYAFVVPTEVIPPEGVQLRVQDQDGPGDFETLGVFHLTLHDLHDGLVQPMLVLSDGAVLRLELSVARAPEPSQQIVDLDVARGLQVVEGAGMMAGELVEIRAQGSYSLAKDRAPVGPAGGGKWKNGNIQEAPFASAEHGAALAVLGLGQRIDKLLVPGCVQLTTRYAGQLVLGINDTGTADNTGKLSFTIFRRVPTAVEWRQTGQVSACKLGPR